MTSQAAEAPKRPRKKPKPRPDAPCVKINGEWVLVTTLVQWRTAWPTVKCGGCPRPAFGLFILSIHRGIPGEEKHTFRTLCSRCALGNSLDPRKRCGIKLVFEICPDAQLTEDNLLVDHALGIGLPHEDTPGRFIAFRESAAEKPEHRTRTLLNVFEAPSAHEAATRVRQTFGHWWNHSLITMRVPEAQSACAT